jgi:hypothetical protein
MKLTTPDNLPYPEPGDDLNPLDEWLADLATATQKALREDTDWLDLTLASGYVAHSGRTPQVRRKNGLYITRGGITTSNGAAMTAGNRTVASLPTGLLTPPANQYFPAFNGFNGNAGTVTLVASNNSIQYQPNITGTTYVYLDGITWLDD